MPKHRGHGAAALVVDRLKVSGDEFVVMRPRCVDMISIAADRTFRGATWAMGP